MLSTKHTVGVVQVRSRYTCIQYYTSDMWEITWCRLVCVCVCVYECLLVWVCLCEDCVLDIISRGGMSVQRLMMKIKKILLSAFVHIMVFTIAKMKVCVCVWC